MVFSATGAKAQFSTPFAGQNDQPIGISADSDIEWNRDEKYYIARGNAQASQGEVFISADVLQAFYRDSGNSGGANASASGAGGLLSGAGAGGTQIFKLVADGNVYAKSGEDILIGSRLEYLIEEELAVITGEIIQLATNQGSVSAREKITYNGKQLYAVAEGDAMVSQDSNIVEAAKITAFFYPTQQESASQAVPGQGRIKRVEAEGSVSLTDGRGFATAERATYDPNSGMAILTCNVAVSQGQNQMRGDFAEYNFESGEANVSVRQIADCKSRGRIIILIDPQTGEARQVQR